MLNTVDPSSPNDLSHWLDESENRLQTLATRPKDDGGDPASSLYGDSTARSESSLPSESSVPALSADGSSLASSNLNTIDTYHLAKGQTHSLENADNVARYPCPLYFLPCCDILTNFEHWKTHIEAHFRGRELPKQAICPLKTCTWPGQRYEDGSRALEASLVHLAGHYERNEGLQPEAWASKDKMQKWYEHLYNQDIITPREWKELKVDGSLAEKSWEGIPMNDPSRAWTEKHNRRERRERRRPLQAT